MRYKANLTTFKQTNTKILTCMHTCMHTGIHLTLTAATEPTLLRAGLEQEKGLPGWAQDAPFKVAKPSNMPVCPHATHTHMPASVSTPRESNPHALSCLPSPSAKID
jgi:hypothetical protein